MATAASASIGKDCLLRLITVKLSSLAARGRCVENSNSLGKLRSKSIITTCGTRADGLLSVWTLQGTIQTSSKRHYTLNHHRGGHHQHFRNLGTMKYFVVGVSGVTCGGKTTLVQLLQRSFPWSRCFYQDAYFLDDDDPRHVRLPDVENHVNYEIPESLDLEKMHQDFIKLFQDPEHGNEAKPCNFEMAGKELVENIKDIGFDTSKYRSVPILIVEGFLIFGSEVIREKCDVRFFVTLDKEECWNRRSQRTTYVPPDVPGYFEKCVWPEYVKHHKECIEGRPDITLFDGRTGVENIWRQSLLKIVEEMEKKCPELIVEDDRARRNIV